MISEELLYLILIEKGAHRINIKMKPEMMTVTVNLNRIGGRYAQNPVLTQAGALFVVIPMIILFLIGQKNFRKGLFAGAIKE